MAPSLSDLTYEERLQRLNLISMKDRRERGDLIEVYRVMNDLEKLDRDDLVIGEERSLRGNGRRLRKATCSRDIKKNSFPQRCVEIWNGLGNEVGQAKTISAFTTRLDESSLKDGTA